MKITSGRGVRPLSTSATLPANPEGEAAARGEGKKEQQG